jgi:hypothetical protein
MNTVQEMADSSLIEVMKSAGVGLQTGLTLPSQLTWHNSLVPFPPSMGMAYGRLMLKGSTNFLLGFSCKVKSLQLIS